MAVAPGLEGTPGTRDTRGPELDFAVGMLVSCMCFDAALDLVTRKVPGARIKLEQQTGPN